MTELYIVTTAGEISQVTHLRQTLFSCMHAGVGDLGATSVQKNKHLQQAND